VLTNSQVVIQRQSLSRAAGGTVELMKSTSRNYSNQIPNRHLVRSNSIVRLIEAKSSLQLTNSWSRQLILERADQFTTTIIN
jgi:hypothetical protein